MSDQIEELTIDDVTHVLDSLVTLKSETLNTLNIAVNEHVALKNEYAIKSNALRIQPDKIREDMGLSKAPSEKQQQAYIDNELSDLLQDLKISEQNVQSWKREVDLLDNKISVEKYRVRLLIGVIEDARKS